MKKLTYSTKIKAPKEKVWKNLWSQDTYGKWTSVFAEGSYADTDWREGSKALFLTPKGEGLSSIIAKNIPNEYMSFKHVTMIKDGIEQPIDEEVKQWSGSRESYSLKEQDGKTELTVELDATEEYEDYFNKTFPMALEKLKTLAEISD